MAERERNNQELPRKLAPIALLETALEGRRPRWTLRRRTLLLFCATLLGLVAAIYAISQTLLLTSYLRLEEKLVRNRTQRALAGVSSLFDVLDTTVGDWAAWDDSYRFIRDRNKQYIVSTLDPISLANLHISYIAYIDTSGRVVEAKAVNPETQKEIPFPPAALKLLTTHPNLLSRADTESAAKYLVNLPQGPLFVVARPILTSARKGPSRGTLVMGRFLDAALVKQMCLQTVLSISILRLQDPSLPGDIRAALPELRAKEEISVRTLSDDAIAGYTLLKDIDGVPFLILRVDSPREVYQQGKASARYILGTLIGAAAVFLALMLLLLERTVLSRMERLGGGILGIARGGDITARVAVEGDDEFSSMAGAINGMLNALEQAQRALGDSEERFRLLAENATDIIARHDSEGRYLYVSPACYAALGYMPEEMIGSALEDFVLPEDRPLLAQNWARAKEQARVSSLTYRCVCKSERILWLEAMAHPLRDPQTGALQEIHVVSRDVTARKRTEERLQMLSLVAQQTLDGVLITDAEANILFANPAAEKLSGSSKKDMMGKALMFFFRGPVNDLDSLEPLQQAIQKGEPISLEIRNRLRADAPSWLEVHLAPVVNEEGRTTHFVIVESDISERKRAEAELQESRRFIERIAASSPNVLYLYDLIEQRNLYFNRAATAVFGFTSEEIAQMEGACLLHRMHPEDRERLPEHQKRLAAAKDGDIVEFHHRLQHANGEWLWLHSRDTVFTRTEAGQPRQILGTAQDITQSKRQDDLCFEQMVTIGEMNARLEAQKDILEETNIKLETLATTDGLTGLKNHRTFQEQLEQEFYRARRYDLPLSLLLLDVDHFKQYNDRYGHPAGDDVLRRVAHLLEERVRRSDFVARYGGEELAIILPNTDLAGALEISERIREAIEAATWAECQVTVSGGVASRIKGTADKAQLISEADVALYAAKQAGRNRVLHHANLPQRAVA